MNIKAKDMILINMEIIKMKSDTIYELFPLVWYKCLPFLFLNIFFQSFQFIKFLSTLVLIIT